MKNVSSIDGELGQQTIKVNEIFYSIQGESTWAGFPTVFVRTSGCNLRCHYCDTKYSYHEGAPQTLKEIIKTIQASPVRHVCITGGEPLLQYIPVNALMSALCDMGYFVSLETSGSKDCRPVDPRVKLILDVKTPSSGAADTFYRENLSLRQPGIEYKFVICNESDFEWSEMFCIENQLNSFAEILFSPSFGQVTEKWLAEKILKNGSLARLHLQQHKYIWTPETRGV